jgi:LVIVD repeat
MLRLLRPFDPLNNLNGSSTISTASQQSQRLLNNLNGFSTLSTKKTMRNQIYCCFFLVLSAFCSLRCTQDNGASQNTTGQAGSLANFLIVGDFLYLLADNELKTFDIKDTKRAVALSKQRIDAVAETIFHLNGLLYIGTQTGMFVYQINSDGRPEYKGEFEHTTGCDPVVANEQYAYVTVHSGIRCNSTFPINTLAILSMANPAKPELVKSYPMSKPLGLGLRGDLLYLCEQEFGLKVFDVSNPKNIVQLEHYKDVHALDVIVLPETLLLLSPQNIYQYSYGEPGVLNLRSSLPIQP